MHAHPNETAAILQKHFANLDAPLVDMAFKLLLASTPRVPLVTAKSLENADDFNIEGGLLKAGEKPYSIARRPAPAGGPAPVEAPFIVDHGGYYWLIASYDYCCKGAQSTYYTVIGRAKAIV